MKWNLNDLHRSRSDYLLGGVCGGLELCTPWAAWVWRALFLATLLFGGVGIAVYLILWIVVPGSEKAARPLSGTTISS